ncbi:MAG: helix-turn-helix domain-containing protein [Pannonibacter phragmitetus]
MTSIIDTTVGANIKRIRQSRGLSQEKVAELLGVTFQQIQKYEKGQNRFPVGRMIVFCRHLNVAPTDVLHGIDWGKGTAPDEPEKWLTPMALKTARLFDDLTTAQRSAVMAMIHAFSSGNADNDGAAS